MKNFVTPHMHPLSLDSASTPKEFVEREIELETGAVTATDHGFMGACSEIYDLAKKNKLVPILGMESYLRDDNCPILAAHGIEKEDDKFAHYNKYYHFCVHCMNEKAYNALSVRLSDAFEKRGEKHGSEIKPIFTWEDVEELGQYDLTMSSGCLIGVSARHLMSERPDIAEAYYQKMRSCVKPGNFIVEIFPHVCDQYFEKGVFLTFGDGSRRKFSWTKKLRIECEGKALEIPADEFSKNYKKMIGPVLVAYKHYHKWIDLPPQSVISAESIEGFLENECRDWAGGSDYQKGANQFMLRMASKYGDKILVSDDSHYHTESRHEVQTMKLTANGGNWSFANNYARMSSQKAFETLKYTLGITEKQFEEWVDNSYEFRDKFKDFKFSDKIQLPTSRYPSDTVSHLKTLINKHGRMKWHDRRWTSRLAQEIELFKNNGTIDLLPYFFLSEEAIDQYNQRGLLTGPGRGSSGGVAIAYLLGITHVDPIENNLSLDRFITVDRIRSGKLPDIDMDLGNVDILKDPKTGWLEQEFGNKSATIATATTLRLKSSIKDAMRSRYGHVSSEVERLCSTIPNPPQGITDAAFLWGYTSEDGKEVKGFWDESENLRAFAESEPKVWEIVKSCLGITRSFSRHASATILSEIPVKEFLPTMLISGVRTTQYTMTGVEARGGLKMDFLGLSTLNDIQDCIEAVQERHGGKVIESKVIDGIKVLPHMCVPFGGEYRSVWNLPEEMGVFKDVCAGNTETVFQLSTQSAIKWLAEFKQPLVDGLPAISTKDGIATFTALDRPGPLDAFVTDNENNKWNMLQEYARRARGEKATGEVKALSAMLKETFGVLVMQEQLQYVYQQLTDCDGIKATEFRTNIAKKKMEKVQAAYGEFIEKATPKVGSAAAKEIFEQLQVFGRYGFCRAHARNYGEIAYVCAFLKHFYPLEWWTSVLKNASKEKIVEKLWKHVSDRVLEPDVQLSGEFFQIEGDKIRAPLSFLTGVGPQAHKELVQGRPYVDFKDFADRSIQTKLKGAKPKLDKDGQPTVVDGQVKMTLGRSSLGPGLVFKLIASGTMDSLFPNVSMAEKIAMYAQYVAESTAKPTKKPRKKPIVAKIPDEWKDIDKIHQYQVSKEILPVYSRSLLRVLADYPSFNIETRVTKSGTSYIQNFKKDNVSDNMQQNDLDLAPLRLIEGNQIKYFDEQFQVVEGQRFLYGSYVYVLAERRFKFPKNAPADEQKAALSITFDSCGQVYEMVKWPDRQSGKLVAPTEDLTGAICFCVFSRYRSDRKAVIESITVVRSSLSKEETNDEESSTSPE